MKKKINKKNVPAYAFGMDQLSNYLGGANVLGSAISGLSGEGSTGDAIGSTLGSAASLAGTGFSIGGPIGAAAGGVLGTAFGWIGARKRKKQMEQMRRRKETMNKTQLGMNAAANQTAEYWDDNELAYTYENGGMLPDLAYVDNNEIIRGDDGTIMQVPNNRPGTDNHLIDASNLESVLSDKIKRPGTNKTFAQEGKKLTRMTKPSKGKDIFADNTNMLNKRNANLAYDNLLSEQEEVKAKKGIKPKKKGIPAYEDGKQGDKTPFYIPITYGSLLGNLPISLLNTVTNSLAANYFYNPNNKKIKPDPNKRLIQTYGSAPAFYAPMKGDGIDAVTYANDEPISVEIPTQPIISQPSVTNIPSNRPVTKTPSTTKSTTTKYTAKPNITKTTTQRLYEPTIPLLNTSMAIDWEDVVTPVNIPTSADEATKKRVLGKPKSGYSPDWLSLAPTVYNTLQSLRGPEEEPLVLNPYAGAVRSTMARRRMNIEPARLANSRSRAISNYNLANINANTGANLAARTQAAVDEYASNANMYATKQNADNAYLGEYANTLNNLGQQFVQSENMYNDLNARNRAAARNFGATATSQLGKWSQVNRQIQNQYNRDQMTLPFLADFLSQGFTKEQVDNLLTRTRNRV